MGRDKKLQNLLDWSWEISKKGMKKVKEKKNTSEYINNKPLTCTIGDILKSKNGKGGKIIED